MCVIKFVISEKMFEYIDMYDTNSNPDFNSDCRSGLRMRS